MLQRVDDEIITIDEPGTKDEVIAKAQALKDEMARLQDEYDQLAPDEQAQNARVASSVFRLEVPEPTCRHDRPLET